MHALVRQLRLLSRCKKNEQLRLSSRSFFIASASSNTTTTNSYSRRSQAAALFSSDDGNNGDEEKQDDDDAASASTIQLYQYTICPFCNRTKAFLDYSQSNYEVIEVNPLTKKEIQWSKDYRKVPIAKINDEPYFGSDKIIDGLLEKDPIRTRLQERWIDSNMNILDFTDSVSSKRWTAFAMDDLAPLLYPNICRTLSDSYAAFGYVNNVDKFSTLDRLAIRGLGSFAMYIAASKVKKKRNITDEREALNEALMVLENDGGLSSSDSSSIGFLSRTSEPHLGDISVYGTLQSIEGLQTHTDVVSERDGPIKAWYERMKHKVEQK